MDFKFKIVTLNTAGLNNSIKIFWIKRMLKWDNIDVGCLQGFHLRTNEKKTKMNVPGDNLPCTFSSK